MKKLENIERKQIFEVPEGYFDRLPAKIQARLVGPARERHVIYRYRLQYVLPALLVVAAVVFWLTPAATTPDVEKMLASVSSDQLVTFLTESEITTEDLLNDVEFSAEEIERVEAEAYGLVLEEDLSPYLDDFEPDNL